MRKAAAIFVLVALLLAVAAPSASAATPGHVIVSFDPSKGELPEGLAIDKNGTIYVSFPFTGEIRAILPDGSQRHVTTLPTGGGFGPTGLAVDATGTLYANDVTTDPATEGVYRIASDGSSVRLPGTGAIPFPNGLAFDQRGNIYVGDSIGGAVWRIPRGGSAELWAQDDILEGDGSAGFGFPIGANGVAVRHNTLFVTVSEGARVVRIPVRPDGSAGAPTVFAEDPALYGSDGIALDVHGGIFVPVIVQSTIVRIAPDGSSIDTIATATDGLDFASSDAFGTGRGQRKTLYAVNFAIGPNSTSPGVIAFDVGVPGDPLP